MPQFHLRAKPHPDEVSVAIGGNGVMATVRPPDHARLDFDPRDLRLATALHYAGAIAERLGTDVSILDESDTIYFIEDSLIPAA
jgi:hypothetical protein